MALPLGALALTGFGGALAANKAAEFFDDDTRDAGDFNAQLDAMNRQAGIDNERTIGTHKDISQFDFGLASKANQQKHEQSKELAKLQSAAQMAQLRESNRANAAANVLNNSTQRSSNLLNAVANASNQRWF